MPSNIRIPKQLPQCELIGELIRKCESRKDTDFDFVGNLIGFKQRVSAEISLINTLFPDYTPHDEKYHITHMFRIADQMLGKKLFKEMNSAELLVLACSIYGHDWGMAVSEMEKELILGSETGDEAKAEFALLINEQSLLKRFKVEEFNGDDEESSGSNNAIEFWRNYVRYSHNMRSGERIRRYCKEWGLGIGEAIARVCEGHGYDIALLSDPDLYPQNFPVIYESVNLRALSIYVRLIDLFDLGDDRTPFVVWNFVWPRNSESLMEWNKHRALQPATFINYLGGGRIIQIDGSTSDHEVYAALMDLKKYCEIQLQECCDLLAEMNDLRHQMNVTNVRWRVVPIGFKGISVQFEFNREKILEILGSEIYKNDRHVFLRELLQNSIDAIRARRASFVSQGSIPPKNMGVIKVTVKSEADGSKTVVWQDDGCGMDENIIKRYLAVAGKSYYQGPEFKRANLKIDPISFFGIGILSCFIVSNKLTIETRTEPYMFKESKSYKIEIVDISKQFRITERAGDGDFGTKVMVFVEPQKIEEIENGSILDVTDYLCKTAGFVEYPILIDEDGKKTMVIHPGKNIDEYKEILDINLDHYDIRKVELEYDWETIVASNDLCEVAKIFKIEEFDLKNDLGLEDYEGVLAYPVPIDYGMVTADYGAVLSVFESIDFKRLVASLRVVGNMNGMLHSGPRLYWTTQHESGECSSNLIFRDGIHMPDTHFKSEELVNPTSGISLPMMLAVNLPKNRTRRIDVGRRQVLENSNKWAKPIFDKWVECLKKDGDNLASLEPYSRLIHLVNFIYYNRIPFSKLENILKREEWPIMIMSETGKLSVVLIKEIIGKEIIVCPAPMGHEMYNSLKKYFSSVEDDGVLLNWMGSPCLVDFAYWSDKPEGQFFGAMSGYYDNILGEFYRLKEVKFLSAPWDGDPPLLQEVWTPKDQKNEMSESIDAREMEKLLAEYDNCSLDKKIAVFGAVFGTDKYDNHGVRFCEPYTNYFTYGKYLNINHKYTKILLSLSVKYLIAKEKGVNEPDIEFLMRGVLSTPKEEKDHSRWAKQYRELVELLTNFGVIKKEASDDYIPSMEYFVPGSLESFLYLKVRKNWNKPFGLEKK